MQVLTSQLAGDGRNADRVLVTENAVLVLDGASAFESVPVDPGEYAETLGQVVARGLDRDPAVPLPEAVATGIGVTAQVLQLRPGRSPSSTVAILRVRDRLADLFVLGDSPIYFGTSHLTHVLRDERISKVAVRERSSYVDALRAGRGYTNAHRRALAELQGAQRLHRNRTGGYWIAEADPTAANHGLSITVSPSSAEWAVLGTDGATELIEAADPGRWPEVTDYDQRQLDELLRKIHLWERDSDPVGRRFPRAKRHDDKTLAVVPRIFSAAETDLRSRGSRPVRPLLDPPDPTIP